MLQIMSKFGPLTQTRQEYRPRVRSTRWQRGQASVDKRQNTLSRCPTVQSWQLNLGSGQLLMGCQTKPSKSTVNHNVFSLTPYTSEPENTISVPKKVISLHQRKNMCCHVSPVTWDAIQNCRCKKDALSIFFQKMGVLSGRMQNNINELGWRRYNNDQRSATRHFLFHYDLL